jgi:hypothetical protein
LLPSNNTTTAVSFQAIAINIGTTAKGLSNRFAISSSPTIPLLYPTIESSPYHPQNVDPQRSSAEGKRPAHNKDLRQDTRFIVKPYDQKERLTTSQLLQEIETRAMASQQQIGLTKAQMTAKQREIRMLQLTSKELSELPSATPVYEGVGKM